MKYHVLNLHYMHIIYMQYLHYDHKNFKQIFEMIKKFPNILYHFANLEWV